MTGLGEATPTGTLSGTDRVARGSMADRLELLLASSATRHAARIPAYDDVARAVCDALPPDMTRSIDDLVTSACDAVSVSDFTARLAVARLLKYGCASTCRRRRDATTGGRVVSSSVAYQVVVSSEKSLYRAWQTQVCCLSVREVLGQQPVVILHETANALRPEFRELAAHGCRE
jgi:hypothetical protein